MDTQSERPPAPSVRLVNEREAAATYEALVLLRYWIAGKNRRKLPYAEADAAHVQERILEAFPRLRKTYTGREVRP